MNFSFGRYICSQFIFLFGSFARCGRPEKENAANIENILNTSKKSEKCIGNVKEKRSNFDESVVFFRVRTGDELNNSMYQNCDFETHSHEYLCSPHRKLCGCAEKIQQQQQQQN